MDTDTSAPYSVSFDTTAVSDGLYDLRLVATDQVGNTIVSASSQTAASTTPRPPPPLTVRVPTCAAPSPSPRPPATRLGIATRTYATRLPAPHLDGHPGCLRHDRRQRTGSTDLRVIVTDAPPTKTTSAMLNLACRQHRPRRLPLWKFRVPTRAAPSPSPRPPATPAPASPTAPTPNRLPAQAGTTNPGRLRHHPPTSRALRTARHRHSGNAGNQTTSATIRQPPRRQTHPGASPAPADGSFVSAMVVVSASSSDPGGSGVRLPPLRAPPRRCRSSPVQEPPPAGRRSKRREANPEPPGSELLAETATVAETKLPSAGAVRGGARVGVVDAAVGDCGGGGLVAGVVGDGDAQVVEPVGDGGGVEGGRGSSSRSCSGGRVRRRCGWRCRSRRRWRSR